MTPSLVGFKELWEKGSLRYRLPQYPETFPTPASLVLSFLCQHQLLPLANNKYVKED